jgi:LacI family transcriptional regulator
VLIYLMFCFTAIRTSATRNMGRKRRVALLIESSRGYGRALLSGVARYARVAGPWIFHHEERSISDTMPMRIRRWRPDGVIARIEHPTLARQLRRLDVPIVDLFDKRMLPNVPAVLADHKAIARLAADHLMSLGLRHFAFCGFSGLAFSEQRGKYFHEYLAARGHETLVFGQRGRTRIRALTRVETRAQYQTGELTAWLRSLPKPIGILACNDGRAYGLLHTREEHGIRVPDDIMIVGVDNDPVWCELSGLSLSSVDPNAERIGYEAAALLDRMMNGHRRIPEKTLVSPRGVVVRQSTNALAIPNREMADLLRYVREHACEGLTVKLLCRHTATARSTLCRWFAKHLGHSPAEELARIRVDRIKELLSTTTMSLEEITHRCGFTHIETMHRLFKRATGTTPGGYRSQFWRRI